MSWKRQFYVLEVSASLSLLGQVDLQIRRNMFSRQNLFIIVLELIFCLSDKIRSYRYKLNLVLPHYLKGNW